MMTLTYGRRSCGKNSGVGGEGDSVSKALIKLTTFHFL